MLEENKWKKVIKLFYKIKHKILLFLGLVFRLIRYKTIYFLDTNFVIQKKDEEKDKRYKKMFFVTKNFYITEWIKNEIEEKLSDKRYKKANKYNLKSISFNDLYNLAPICPIYHNFLSTMNNPADITSPQFSLQLIFSKIIKNIGLTEEEEKLYKNEMDEIKEKAKSKIEIDGNPKTEWDEVMDEAILKSIKKRENGLTGKNKNYANDIRNLALIFTYSVIYKKNITFLTSDSDAIAYFFDWSSSIVQQMVFNMKCLEELNKNEREGMKKVFKGEQEAIFFEPSDFIKFQQGTLTKFYTDHKKYFSPRLSIKYWNQKREKYFEIGINMDDSYRLILKYLHGTLNCPTAKNDLMGSFLAYRYWWLPLPEDMNKLKIVPELKPEIYKESKYIPANIHDKRCLYRKNDLSNNFSAFSTFR
jgi:hypothetical protein